MPSPATSPRPSAGRASFQSQELFLFEGQLFEEERMIRDSASAYAGEKRQPRVEHAFLAEETDPEILRGMDALDLLGITVPEQYSGITAGCVNRTLRHSMRRDGRRRSLNWRGARQIELDHKQFGNPLAQKQLLTKKQADMMTEMSHKLKAFLRVGRLFEQGNMAHEMTSVIKRNNCGTALEIPRHTRDMHGSNDISTEFQMIGHVVNLETVNINEGTHDLHALTIGRNQTGLQSFSKGRPRL